MCMCVRTGVRACVCVCVYPNTRKEGFEEKRGFKPSRLSRIVFFQISLFPESSWEEQAGMGGLRIRVRRPSPGEERRHTRA